MGVGLNLALLKDNKYGDPRFVFFFLKGKMIVHEIKQNCNIAGREHQSEKCAKLKYIVVCFCCDLFSALYSFFSIFSSVARARCVIQFFVLVTIC